MKNTVHEAVRQLWLAFPEAEEVVSNGMPDFRVRGKTFASYVVNHHGDGRVALWLNAPPDAQDHCLKVEPRDFFLPPYVGPRGWLGVHLNGGLSWPRIATLVRQAYEKVAPPALAKSVTETVKVTLPVTALSPEQIDPLKSRRAQSLLTHVRSMVSKWPEVIEDTQFGSHVWRAGKKTFLWVRAGRGSDLPVSSDTRRPRLQLHFWAGVSAQALMTADERFEIPAYLGHLGWIALDATQGCDWKHVRDYALTSYRHFALKRMLGDMLPSSP